MRKKLKSIFLSFVTIAAAVAIAVIVIFTTIEAGTLNPTASPETATMYTLSDIYDRLIDCNDTASEGVHDFYATAAPTGTMHTLTDIYDNIPTIIASTVVTGTTYLGVAGTATSGPDYSKQSLVEKDDAATGDAEGEESAWTNSCPIASANCSEDVYKDGRTGLYWSSSQGTADNNNFTISTCIFFSTEPRGNYDGSDPDCGDDPDPYNANAINMCGLLSIDANDDGINETDWYLPSQKELQQAYIDGMYNQAGSTFTTSYNFWSCTEYSGSSTLAWGVTLRHGYAGTYDKTISSNRYVRCVRR